MKTVITYGTFDLFHIGHLRLLQRARSFGDRLVVGCSTDDFNRKKGKAALIPFEQRVEVLRACRYVDEVFPEESWEQKRIDIERFDAKVLVMGDDWAGRFDDLEDVIDVVYVPRTTDVSTTDIRMMAQQLAREKVSELRGVAKRLMDLIEALG